MGRPPPCTSSLLRNEQHPSDIGSIPTKELRSHSGSRAAHSGSSAEFDIGRGIGNSTHSRSRGASQSTARIGPPSDCSDAEQPRWAEILAELDMMSAAFSADHEQQTESSHARSSKQLLHDAAATPEPLLVRERSASSDRVRPPPSKQLLHDASATPEPLLVREQSGSSDRVRPLPVVIDRCSVSPGRPVGLVVSSALPDKDAQVSRQAVRFPLVATPANARVRPPVGMLAVPPPIKQVGLRTGPFTPMVAGSGAPWHDGVNMFVASPRVAGHGC